MKLKHLLIAALIAPAALNPLPARGDSYDSEAAARKADYFFLEAARNQILEESDRASALMKRAFDLTGCNPTAREAFERGRNLMYMGSYYRDSVMMVTGVKLCDDYFAANHDDEYAGSFMGNYHGRAGNLDRAISIYGILCDAHPQSAGYLAAQAELLTRTSRFDEAAALYRRLEKSLGRSPEITERISSLRWMQGDTLGAFAEIDSLIAGRPRNLDAIRLGAKASMLFGQPQRGLAYIDQARAVDPADGLTYFYASEIYKALGRTDDYERAIAATITTDGLDLETKTELLRFYLQQEIVPDNSQRSDSIASAMFESLVSQYAHDFPLRMLYMSYLASRGQWADAAEQVENALAIDPSDPATYVLLARLYGSADDLVGTVRTARAGLARFPGNVELYRLLSGGLMALDHPDEAIATLRTALALDSIADDERSSLICSVADLGQQTGMADDSISRYYEQALEIDPENDLAMNNYAYWLATSGGNLLRAKELIAKAVVYEPGSSTYFDTYAWVCFQLGELTDAKRYIDMAILFDKSNDAEAASLAEMLQHAAEIYARLGLADQAKDFSNRAKQAETASPNE